MIDAEYMRKALELAYFEGLTHTMGGGVDASECKM